MSLLLTPMTAERFRSWNEHQIAVYAQDKVDAGTWPEADAVQRSADENAALLPQGTDTPGHHLFVGLTDGHEVGTLWLFSDAATSEAFIYDIEVDPDQRGKGHGRELLEGAEAWCADHSIGVLRLHVFGFNDVAISLYESAGFETTDITMAKQIR